MNLSCFAYDLLYNSNDGDRHKILNLSLIALRCYDDNVEYGNFL